MPTVAVRRRLARLEQAAARQAEPQANPQAEAILSALRTLPTCSSRRQTASTLRQLYRLTVTGNAWVPVEPTRRQAEFLLCLGQEAFYGGAAGGGKSSALLAAALMFVDVPGYAALLLRRRFSDLALPGALMHRAHEWLGGTEAHWLAADHRWLFPSGASLSFGYLENENDKYRYQSAEFQFIGFDELTQFSESQFTYLFSRLRRLADVPLPLRMRSASNPGGVGHLWAKERYLGGDRSRVFVPARLDDNPHLDRAEYVASLAQLDPVTRARLLAGDWDVTDASMFRREWFRLIDAAPSAEPGERLPNNLRKVRFWDLASTEHKPGTDPDWTVGVLMGRAGGTYYVLDVRRTRGTPGAVEALVKQTAEMDGKGVQVVIEQEPGSAGVALVASYVRALAGWAVRGVKPTGDKATRAAPLASQAEAGNVRLVRAPWNRAFLDELELFPGGGHDDQVDAAAGAFGHLAAHGTITAAPQRVGSGMRMPWE